MGEEQAASWEYFPHVADIGVRGYGASKADAFEQAALAMVAIVTDPAVVSPVEEIAISCEAPDDELLLLQWLNDLIYEMSSRRMLFGRFRVRIEGERLEGTAWGEPVDLLRHEPGVEVKGATLTEIEVSRGADGRWMAQCVVDV